MSRKEMEQLSDAELRKMTIKKNKHENATEEELLAQYVLYERFGGIGSKPHYSIDHDYYENYIEDDCQNDDYYDDYYDDDDDYYDDDYYQD